VTNQNTDQENWWGENTHHIASLRGAEQGAEIEYPDLSLCPQGDELNKTSITDRKYTARFQVDANKYFGEEDQHNIDATFGIEINSDKYRSHASTARGYYRSRGESFVTDIDPTKYSSYASWLANNVPTIEDNLTNEFSTYLSLTYAHRNIWRVNLNGRIDGSNKFGDRSNDKFLPIWSLLGSYDVGHWIQARWIDYITAKANYGFQGNMLDTENPLMTIKKGTMSSYYNEYLSTIVNHPNPDLKWEKTSSYNLGLDMSFFDHRLEMEISAYYKKTKDAFMNKKVSSVNGVDSYIINGGDVTNKGYSFDITATPVRTKDFRWSISTSLSKIINTVDTRPDAQTYELSDFLNGTAIVKNKSVNTFYSYRFLGLSPVNGGPLIDDYFDNQQALRGLSKYDTYTTVLEASGKRDADIQGSLTNTFRYKNWHANFVLGYSLGAKTRLFRMYGSNGSAGVYGTDIYSEKNYSRDFMNRWQKLGDELTTNIPAIMSSSNDGYYQYARVWTDFSNNSLEDQEDKFWTLGYEKINKCNMVIDAADDMSASNDTEAATLRHVKGECHFLRASYYLMLANLYGKPYAPSTAATDPAVPIKLSSSIDDKEYQRNIMTTAARRSSICYSGCALTSSACRKERPTTIRRATSPTCSRTSSPTYSISMPPRWRPSMPTATTTTTTISPTTISTHSPNRRPGTSASSAISRTTGSDLTFLPRAQT
jgi:hypothetical protein